MDIQDVTWLEEIRDMITTNQTMHAEILINRMIEKLDKEEREMAKHYGKGGKKNNGI